MGKTLRLVLGDQLNSQHSWFGKIDRDVAYVMMEVLPETAYVTHHIQKVAGFFSAMRNFASEMKERGHHFIYFRLDDPQNRQTFEANISDLLESGKFARFEYLLPDEYRLDQQLSEFTANLTIPAAVYDTEHFMYHSRLSFALNTKMISPLEVVKKIIEYWQQHQKYIGIAQVEGFVRQIIGWREYMRGIYWAKMPEYEKLNYFDHQSKLPAFYWSGDTKMNCLRQVIIQSLDKAYAHHIQRLMVVGNFAALAGVHPDAVDEWYLGIYIDAIQWVEITNTRGMSQFADGGIAATKPYVSSANYIHKMSDYCKSCRYDRSKRHGENACPFNSLYWDFFERHRDKLENNHRVGMVYRTLDKMDPQERRQIRGQAAFYKNNLDNL